MPRLSHRLPKLRRHKERDLAFVCIEGRKLYLGRWGSAEAKRQYARVIGEWKAGSRGAPPAEPGVEITVAELLVRFLRHAKKYYQASNEYDHFVVLL